MFLVPTLIHEQKSRGPEDFRDTKGVKVDNFTMTKEFQ